MYGKEEAAKIYMNVYVVHVLQSNCSLIDCLLHIRVLGFCVGVFSYQFPLRRAFAISEQSVLLFELTQRGILENMFSSCHAMPADIITTVI